MPVTEVSSTEILVESQLYQISDRKRRVKDRLVITLNPREGDYEVEIFEGNGSNQQALIVLLPEELIALANAILAEIPTPGSKRRR
jgi:hypothetical protein